MTADIVGNGNERKLDGDMDGRRLFNCDDRKFGGVEVLITANGCLRRTRHCHLLESGGRTAPKVMW